MSSRSGGILNIMDGRYRRARFEVFAPSLASTQRPYRTAKRRNYMTWLERVGTYHRLYRVSVLASFHAKIHASCSTSLWFVCPLRFGEPEVQFHDLRSCYAELPADYVTILCIIANPGDLREAEICHCENSLFCISHPRL